MLILWDKFYLSILPEYIYVRRVTLLPEPQKDRFLEIIWISVRNSWMILDPRATRSFCSDMIRDCYDINTDAMMRKSNFT